jgi:hypothetical protein
MITHGAFRITHSMEMGLFLQKIYLSCTRYRAWGIV